ncbi:hypothetical protein [Oceanibium sediminis]|uniref:hypothetical protein n=1 Tax=Oceanibium sediminis TaxID=2026339 RepID=UPI000DD37DFD|nr:hypothetical protein [Oceanibium sediminis]
MRRTYPAFLAALLAVTAGVAPASEPPRSVIGWLSDVLDQPPEPVGPGPRPPSDAVAPFEPAAILTSSLDDPVRDGIGVLAPEETGLPRDIWGTLSALRVRNLIYAQELRGVPATVDLHVTLMLADTKAPVGSGAANGVLLSRIDTLMAAGRLDDAAALLSATGHETPDLFRRAFDIALLKGRADPLCARLSDSPGLSPTLMARVYCLALLGDWSAAALTLNLGREVGEISVHEEALLSRFLDPELFEGVDPPPIPEPLTTLDFILREAVALPRPAGSLPLAFLFPDAADSAPLRARLIARERLVREGALSPDVLFAAYRDGTPAASGGVWDRMALTRKLDQALAIGEADDISDALQAADRAFAAQKLRPALARVYARQLDALPKPALSPATRQRIGELLLLANRGAAAADWFPDTNDRASRFFAAFARGEELPLAGDTALPPLKAAVIAGLTRRTAPSEDASRIEALLTGTAYGEGLLRTLALLAPGPEIDPGDLTSALYLLRVAGLEPQARQIAAETLLLLPEA